MESIIDYLKRKLKEAGPARWEAIAILVSEGVDLEKDKLTYHSLRKIAYGDRQNPGLQDAQRLIDFFHSVERGERDLPEPAEKQGA